MGETIFIKDSDKEISRIYLEEGLDGISCRLGERPLFVLCDRNVAHVAEAFSGKASGIMPIDVSEDSKTIDTVMKVIEWLLENGADRDALLLSVGGGIVSDIGGFTAAIYKRGIGSAYIPTTLLSQVDASIGGKTGVNLGGYKNMVGVIRQPETVYICPVPLRTLPYRQFLSGSAEMLKTFLIGGGSDYSEAVALLSEICRSGDRTGAIRDREDRLLSLIGRAASVKAGIVSEDQFESGLRRKLNLGHTFAHAIESLSFKEELPVAHGHAVAMGIIAAAYLADSLSCGERGDFISRLKEDFISCGLPVALPFCIEDMAPVMMKDKKAENGMVHFVTVHDVGDVRVADMTVDDAVRRLAVYV